MPRRSVGCEKVPPLNLGNEDFSIDRLSRFLLVINEKGRKRTPFATLPNSLRLHILTIKHITYLILTYYILN